MAKHIHIYVADAKPVRKVVKKLSMDTDIFAEARARNNAKIKSEIEKLEKSKATMSKEGQLGLRQKIAELEKKLTRDAAVDPEKYYVCGAATGMIVLGPFNTLEEALAAKKARRYGSDVSATKGSTVIKKSKAFG
jgi:Flp pilus assembly secretin CpaC